jgi:hypothetical protein
MTTYWYISNDFHEKRSTRIGASEVSALIPNIEKPNESLAGYGSTAVTLWQEKTGRKERSVSGLPAEMGHWNEPKAAELFIRGIDPEIANEYLISRLTYEIASKRNPSLAAINYQPTPFKHNTQWYNDQFIVHCDGIYDTNFEMPGKIIDAHGYKIDTSSPFLIEAKNHGFFAARRPENSIVTGYDFDLKGWQGIPLKEYVQCQFQMANMDVEKNYLCLVTDSALGTFHVWEILRDRKTGDQLIDLASRFAWHVKHDEPPKEMAMNSLDIQALYPEIREDFYFEGDPERRTAIIEAAKSQVHAAEQEEAWKQKKDDASDALSVYLADNKELRIELDGEIRTVAKWIEKKGGERVAGLKEIAKDEKAYRYLKRKGFVNTGDDSRYVKVSWREE